MSTSRSHVSAAEIEQILRAALNPLELKIQDDSAAHAGHAGAAEGSHFSLRIVSAQFKGLSHVAKHRLVYDALRLQMARGIHALSIDAVAPAD